MIRPAVLAAALLVPVTAAGSDTIRVASFDTELQRSGPGLLLRDIDRGDPQVAAVVAVIAAVRPDILALQGLDWDYDNRALDALAEALARAGQDFPHRFAARPNSGMATGLDLDGDGRTGGPGDAQGYGAFTGQGGIAVLSRFPILDARIRDFSALLWRDLPGANLPRTADGRPFPSAEAQAIQRLSSTAHWAVPIDVGADRPLVLLTFRATPPVFDGPEDRNGWRNHDEIGLWRAYLDGALGPGPAGPVVLAGNANLDPARGEGRHEAIRALLDGPQLRDPGPASVGAMTEVGAQQGADPRDTVEFARVGRLRTDYVLPARALTVIASGVHWPAPGSPGHAEAVAASRHRLVWVDLGLP